MFNYGSNYFLIETAKFLKELEFKESNKSKKYLIEEFLFDARTKAASILMTSSNGLFGNSNSEIDKYYLKLIGKNISERLPEFLKTYCLISPSDSRLKKIQIFLQGGN